jgi:hypothetical protein
MASYQRHDFSVRRIQVSNTGTFLLRENTASRSKQTAISYVATLEESSIRSTKPPAICGPLIPSEKGRPSTSNKPSVPPSAKATAPLSHEQAVRKASLRVLLLARRRRQWHSHRISQLVLRILFYCCLSSIVTIGHYSTNSNTQWCAYI